MCQRLASFTHWKSWQLGAVATPKAQEQQSTRSMKHYQHCKSNMFQTRDPKQISKHRDSNSPSSLRQVPDRCDPIAPWIRHFGIQNRIGSTREYLSISVSILRTRKRTIILTTTHISIYIYIYIDKSLYISKNLGISIDII